MTKRWLAVLLLSLVPAVSRAAEPPSLRVQVVDGKGRAVAGAKVRAGNARQDAGQQRKVAETVVSATTSPIGMARLSGLPVHRALWVPDYVPTESSDHDRPLRTATRGTGS